MNEEPTLYYKGPFGLTTTGLKFIAMITMLIDHIGLGLVYYGLIFPSATPSPTLWTVYHICRNIGRISFPIFLFVLVQGFLHTADRKRYILRLLIFALLSEIPFDLAIYQKSLDPGHQNVIWTMLLGIIMLMIIEQLQLRMPGDDTAIRLMTLLVFAALAGVLHTDYRYYGIIAIYILYMLRYNKVLQLTAGAVSFLWEPWAVLAFPILYLYNGRKGQGLKYLFYFFYPVHLLIIVLIRTLML